MKRTVGRDPTENGRLMELSTDVKFVKSVGEKRARAFARLGVLTVGDLLRDYPRAYEDCSAPLTLAEAPADAPCCVRARIEGLSRTRNTFAGGIVTTAEIYDGLNRAEIVFFNNKYIGKILDRGGEHLFYGKVEAGEYTGYKMTAPLMYSPDNAGLIPVYPATSDLPSRAVSAAVKNALDAMGGGIPDSLPSRLIEKYRLLRTGEALKKIHFPKDADELAAARRTLVFEELLTLQLGLYGMKSSRSAGGAPVIEDRSGEFTSSLPFRLTGAQARAIADCCADMRSGAPMNRLLQGDVGSGKTAVAAALCYSAAKSGFQCAVMAPTEVLAKQHYDTFLSFFNGTDLRVALLTGSMTAKGKRETKALLESGEIDVLIGTHALITPDVAFRSLALVVTDEQHRFGVRQRGALVSKGVTPHTLVMSATPIPRTLALMIYGDLDITVLDEMPPGRTPVKTYSVGTDMRGRIYAFLKKQIDSGRQCFIVCPAVEESDAGLAAAREYAEKLSREEFAGYGVGLLYGSMKPKDKNRVMEDFASGKLGLLVSTTVIEVGVDVPNATVMAVENAERFGLSQLHQLRGRIGRGKHESFCILISDAQNPDALDRLGIMCRTSDGFKIAEEDLRLRGPGDFFGQRQSGLPDLHIADLQADGRIIAASQKIAREIITEDPTLSKPENACLRKGVSRLFRDYSA